MQEVIQKLEHSCNQLSSELEIVTEERDNLRNDLSKLAFRQQKFPVNNFKNSETSGGNFLNETVDTINVDDLARSLWSSAMRESAKEKVSCCDACLFCVVIIIIIMISS